MLEQPVSKQAGPSRRAFIYVSATDAFSPLVPKRYIESKRQAEAEIARLSTPAIRDVFLRPGEFLLVTRR